MSPPRKKTDDRWSRFSHGTIHRCMSPHPSKHECFCVKSQGHDGPHACMCDSVWPTDEPEEASHVEEADEAQDTEPEPRF